MPIRFEDIHIEVPRRSNDSPLEVTLFEGVRTNMISSSVPCAYGRDKTSDNPGMVLVGYPVERTDTYLAMTSDKISEPGATTKMGGYHLYKDAIHSIRQLHSD